MQETKKTVFFRSGLWKKKEERKKLPERNAFWPNATIISFRKTRSAPSLYFPLEYYITKGKYIGSIVKRNIG